MTPQQIQLVCASFALLRPRAEAFARDLDTRLSALDPTLRSMLDVDPAQHPGRLMETMGITIGLLDKPKHLLPPLKLLGARLAAQGVEAADYTHIARALQQAIEAAPHVARDAATRQAWQAVMAFVGKTMQQGAAEAQRAAEMIEFA